MKTVKAALPVNEISRIAALRALGVLDTESTPVFDALVKAASLVCGVPIALVSLVDAERQWFKANLGLPGVKETPRDLAFCAHAILGDEILEIPDATADARTADNALVTGEPDIRFYAGAPLRLGDGHLVGTLCVIDRQPRRLDETQREILRCLGVAAAMALDSWKLKTEAQDALEGAKLSLAATEKAEAALLASREFLDIASQVAKVGGWSLEIATGKLDWTDETYRIHGVAPGVALSLERLIGFYAPEDRPVLKRAFERAMSEGVGWDLELKQIRNDGAFTWLRKIGTVIFSDGRPSRLQGAVQDVTARMARQIALEEANSQLEEFTYVASHDLRSPLRGIGDLLTWIREDIEPTPLFDTVRRNFERAQLRVENADRMIDDLLDYAKAGRDTGILEPLDPAGLVDEALTLLTLPAGFKVEQDITARPLRTAHAPLALAIRNLLGNAIKHHGGTTGLIRVTMRDDGWFLVIRVEDDGVGVSPGAEARIFKLFQRATTAVNGHGVGLAVTRRMINSRGGTIELDRAGTLKGACFKICWPRREIKEIDQ